jgi:hypothetical protein
MHTPTLYIHLGEIAVVGDVKHVQTETDLARAQLESKNRVRRYKHRLAALTVGVAVKPRVTHRHAKLCARSKTALHLTLRPQKSPPGT